LLTYRSPATSDYISGSPSFCLEHNSSSNNEVSGDADDEASEKEDGKGRRRRGAEEDYDDDTCEDRGSACGSVPSVGKCRAANRIDAVCVEENDRRKPISRSKSDISHR
jgi:hypothetical protein